MQNATTLPIEKVYQRLSMILWPWDESICRVCGWPLYEEPVYCTSSDCAQRPVPERRADAPPDLSCWQGVGMVVEEMEKRGFEVTIQRAECGWGAKFIWEDRWTIADSAWESVARAALAALEG